MSKKRAIFFQIFTPILLLTTIYISWDIKGLWKKEAVGAASQASTEDLEERLFLNQSKVILGAMKIVGERYRATDGAASAVEQTNANLKKIFRSIVLEEHPLLSPESKAARTRSTNSSLLRSQALVSYALGFDREAIILLDGALERETSPELKHLTELLRPALAHASAETAVSVEPGSTAPSAEEAAEIQRALGWYGELFLVSSQAVVPEKEAVAERVYGEAKTACIKFFAFGIMIVLLLVLSLFLSLIFLVLAASRRLRFRFALPEGTADFCLEIFALYLVGMLAGPQVIRLLQWWGVELDSIRSSIVMILCMLLMMAWPLLNRVPWKDVARALGLNFGGPGKIAADVAAAPAAYVGSLFFFLVFLSVYSIILVELKVNVSSGTHPVVPILLSDADTARSAAIILLAVVIAPLVEEVMFRGALYSWLRARMRAGLAILASSLTFAIVHPQGPIGIAPLMAIGCVLALLREWRGSLVSPVFAHGCFNAGTLLLIYLFLM